MHVVFKIQGLICASLDPTGRTPSAILSQYFGKPVHLIMKGPKRRVCPPTHAFPDLEASSVFQDVYPFLVASEESLAEVGRVVRAYARDESPAARVGGLDREAWRDSDVPIERCVHPYFRRLRKAVPRTLIDPARCVLILGSVLISSYKVQACLSPKTCGAKSSSDQLPQQRALTPRASSR